MVGRNVAGRGSNQYRTRPGTAAIPRGTNSDLRHLIAAVVADDEQPVEEEQDPEQAKRRIATHVSALAVALAQKTSKAGPVNTDLVIRFVARVLDIAATAPPGFWGSDEPDEQDVAWAFEHPDEAAAGFTRHSIHELETVWGGSLDKAAVAHSNDGLSPFEVVPVRAGGARARYEPVEPEWFDHQFHNISMIQRWKEVGFTATEAAELRDQSVHPSEAEPWQNQGFTPAEIVAWAPLFRNPKTAVEWRDAGFGPDEAASWSSQGHTPKSAARHHRKGVPVDQASKLGPGGIIGRSWKNLAARVGDAGFDVADPEPSSLYKTGWEAEVRDPVTSQHIATIYYDTRGHFRRAEPSLTVRQALRFTSSNVTTVKDMMAALPKWQNRVRST